MPIRRLNAYKREISKTHKYSAPSTPPSSISSTSFVSSASSTKRGEERAAKIRRAFMGGLLAARPETRPTGHSKGGLPINSSRDSTRKAFVGGLRSTPIETRRSNERARGCAGHSRERHALRWRSRKRRRPSRRSGVGHGRPQSHLPVRPSGWDYHSSPVGCIVCAMILPQVHLRKPCYDFSFL